MAQGKHKLKKQSVKTNKKQQTNKATNKNKPNKSKKFSANAALAYKNKTAITKGINRRNEALVASKAIANNGSKSDTTFQLLKDLNETGNRELNAQNRLRTKSEKNAKNVSARLQEQLKKLNN